MSVRFPIAVEPFIEHWRQQQQLTTDQAILEFLVGWACQLPIVQEIRTVEEAYQLLWEEFSPKGSSVPLKDALLLLVQRCSLDWARSLIWEMYDAGSIRLAAIQFPHLTKISLPDGTGRAYTMLEFVPKLPSISISKLRQLLFSRAAIPHSMLVTSAGHPVGVLLPELQAGRLERVETIDVRSIPNHSHGLVQYQAEYARLWPQLGDRLDGIWFHLRHGQRVVMVTLSHYQGRLAAAQR